MAWSWYGGGSTFARRSFDHLANKDEEGSGTYIDNSGVIRYRNSTTWHVEGGIVVRYADLARIHGMGRIHASSKDIARMIMLEPERTYLEIGNHFGVTKQRVGAIARRLDIARYTKGVRDDVEP